MNKEEYVFGRVVTEEIPANEADYWAKIFGEGSSSLEELIKYCIKNQIKTIACCKGHSKMPIETIGNDEGYIAFDFTNDSNNKLIRYLCELSYKMPKLTVELDNYMNRISVTLRVPSTSLKASDKYFDIILLYLKKYEEIKDTYQCENEDVNKIINYCFYEKINSLISIRNNVITKYLKNGIYVAPEANCPSFSDTKVSDFKRAFLNTYCSNKNIDDLLYNGLKQNIVNNDFNSRSSK